jgi:predicted Zn-dependent protease
MIKLRVHPGAVADLARKIYGSALAFIVAHELGHIYYQHPDSKDVPREQERQHEVEADRFAIQLLRRMGSPPGGEVFFFDLLAHLEQNRFDFPTGEEYEHHLASATHPLTSDRLQALGQEIERWAGDFAREERDVQQATLAIRNIGQAMRALADLKGRGHPSGHPDRWAKH